MSKSSGIGFWSKDLGFDRRIPDLVENTSKTKTKSQAWCNWSHRGLHTPGSFSEEGQKDNPPRMEPRKKRIKTGETPLYGVFRLG